MDKIEESMDLSPNKVTKIRKYHIEYFKLESPRILRYNLSLFKSIFLNQKEGSYLSIGMLLDIHLSIYDKFKIEIPSDMKFILFADKFEYNNKTSLVEIYIQFLNNQNMIGNNSI